MLDIKQHSMYKMNNNCFTEKVEHGANIGFSSLITNNVGMRIKPIELLNKIDNNAVVKSTAKFKIFKGNLLIFTKQVKDNNKITSNTDIFEVIKIIKDTAVIKLKKSFINNTCVFNNSFNVPHELINVAITSSDPSTKIEGPIYARIN